MPIAYVIAGLFAASVSAMLWLLFGQRKLDRRVEEMLGEMDGGAVPSAQSGFEAFKASSLVNGAKRFFLPSRATLGSLLGGQCAIWLGRRLSYCLISLATVSITFAMFQLTAPLQASFHPVVCAQGFVATLFFGWLPLYLPELFPTHVRAAGSGIAYNVGRFATALGVLAAGALFAAMGGSYPRVGATCGLIYLLGLIVIGWAPDTTQRKLDV